MTKQNRYIRCLNKWFELDIFDGQVYSDTQAWIWLNSKASARNVNRNVKGLILPVRRGELYVTISDLTSSWRWGNNRAVAFIRLLKDNGLITTRRIQGRSLVKLTNYEEEQNLIALDPQYQDAFQDFWDSYKPLHTNKGSKSASRKAYAKALKVTTPDIILESLQTYIEKCKADNIYTKAVTTWLNQEMWTVEYDKTKTESDTLLDDAYQRMMFDKQQ